MIHNGFTDAEPWHWVSRKLTPCPRAGTDSHATKAVLKPVTGSDLQSTSHAIPSTLHKAHAMRAWPLISVYLGTRQAERRHRLWHDSLTGLPNRPFFLERLQHVTDRARRDPTDYAVLLLEVDDFQGVNKHFGHAAGDYVLIEFSRRVRRLLGPSDTFARLGSDEFAVLLEQPGGHAGVWRVAQRLCQGLRAPFSTRGLTLHCRACAGATLGHLPGYRPEDLMKRANQALQRAKQTGKACFAVM